MRLQAVLDSFAQPGDDEDLVFVTRLIQLACSARAILKHGGGFPAASLGLITRLYPALMAACLADATAYTGTPAVQRRQKAGWLRGLPSWPVGVSKPAGENGSKASCVAPSPSPCSIYAVPGELLSS